MKLYKLAENGAGVTKDQGMNVCFVCLFIFSCLSVTLLGLNTGSTLSR